MLPLGLYGVAHTYWTVFAGALRGEQAERTRILAAAGTTTALVAGVMCLAQNQLKHLLAFSSIRHIGPFLIGIALFTPHALTGTFIYILTHGTLSVALFLGVGILLHRYASVDEIELQGRGRPLYITGTLFFCAGISLAGLPPFGTHIGNTLIDEFARAHGYPWIVIVSIIATMFTTGAVLRATGRVFLGWGTKRRNQR
jgi:multicomponent Na+:H+ antiporter subunit D